MWKEEELKAAVKRKETAWKEVLGARDEDAKEKDVWKFTQKRKVKRCIYQRKEEVNEQFRRKMNQDVNGNRTLFWKEVSKTNRGKVENCKKNKRWNGRLALGEVEVRRIQEYFEIFILQIVKSNLKSTQVALMRFEEATTSEES